MEQFEVFVFKQLEIHHNDQQVKGVRRAAIIADACELTHKGS